MRCMWRCYKHHADVLRVVVSSSDWHASMLSASLYVSSIAGDGQMIVARRLKPSVSPVRPWPGNYRSIYPHTDTVPSQTVLFAGYVILK